jgi:hypothetical protein
MILMLDCHLHLL